VRFDVVTAVGIERYVFWDTTTCGSTDRYSHNKGEDSRALALGTER
jgi:hypothetical protein